MTSLLIPDFDLGPHNTLAVPARSRFGAVVTDKGVLEQLVAEAEERGLPLRMLGGGSNVVLSSQFEGVTALMGIKGISVLDGTAEAALVEVGAGETWHDLVAQTVRQGLGGLENLAAIPGTVGAAPVQNIGAYGVELADRFEQLEAYDHEKRMFRVFSREDCRFAYRDSVFKAHPGRFTVVSVRLRLPRPWVPVLNYAGLSTLGAEREVSAERVFETVVAVRASKLPDWRTLPNAGSFFHNPVVPVAVADALIARHPGAPRYPAAEGFAKLSAGWLIERAGLKGYRQGPVGVSEQHALVLVNPGHGTQEDVAALARHIQAKVEAEFGVRLTPEPIFM